MVSKILVLSKDINLSASMDYVKDLCSYMGECGIETHVVCYGEKDADFSPSKNLHVHQVKFILGANNPYSWHMLMNNEMKRRAREVIESRGGFDVLHCIDWISYPATAGVSSLFGIPFIVTIRSTEKERGFSIPESGLISEMEWHTAKEAKKIITLSETTRNILVHDYKMPPEKVVHLWGEGIFEITKNIYDEITSREEK